MHNIEVLNLISLQNNTKIQKYNCHYEKLFVWRPASQKQIFQILVGVFVIWVNQPFEYYWITKQYPIHFVCRIFIKSKLAICYIN